MPQHQNKFSLFWQELKRRIVLQVITVYASDIFVLIELIGNSRTRKPLCRDRKPFAWGEELALLDRMDQPGL